MADFLKPVEVSNVVGADVEIWPGGSDWKRKRRAGRGRENQLASLTPRIALPTLLLGEFEQRRGGSQP